MTSNSDFYGNRSGGSNRGGRPYSGSGGFAGGPAGRNTGTPGQGRPGGMGGAGYADTVVRGCASAVDKFMNPDEDPHGALLIENAEKLAQHLKAEGMTTSQIRNLFTAVRRINYKDDDGPYEVSMLRAKFAYAAGRHKSITGLQRVVDEALKCIKNERQFQRFVDFFEAVVAYHRALGGRE